MTSMICKMVKAGQTAKKLTNYIAKKAVDLTGDIGLGPQPLDPNNLSFAVQALLANHTSRRASQVRHIILSTPRGTPREAAIPQLKKVATDWLATYAPRRPWCFGIHIDNGVTHGHLAVANCDAEGKALKLRPHQVKAMASMTFTTHAVMAQGKRKSVKVYTKSHQLAVRDLAALVLDERGNLCQPVWTRLLAKGIVGDFRRRSDGSPISFAYQSRRIRLATLRAFVVEKQNTKTMPVTTLTPTKPMPPKVAEQLHKLGFTPQDLDHLMEDMRKASAQLDPQQQPTTRPTVNAKGVNL